VTIGIAIAFAIYSILCVGLTVISLPGTWLIVTAAVAIQGFYGPMFGWWPIGIAIGLCVLAEIAETLASGAGAAKAGASRRASIGAIVGGIVGALIGTVVIPIPLVGTVLGGVIGAAGAAMALELSLHESVRKSTSVADVGKGAAVGKLLSTVIKSGFALAIAIVLIVASAM